MTASAKLTEHLVWRVQLKLSHHAFIGDFASTIDVPLASQGDPLICLKSENAIKQSSIFK